MFYAVFFISIPLVVAIYYGIFGGSIYQFRKHLRLASGQELPESTPATRLRNRKIGAVIVIALLLAFSVSVWRQYQQITRQLASAESAKASRSYVSDEAHVLNAQTTLSLNNLCTQANEKYNTRIALYTVASLNGTSIQSLAQNLLQQQIAGSTGRRTLIIVLVPQNRERTLTNTNVQAIGNEALPSLRAKNYGAALSTMVQGVNALLDQEPGGQVKTVAAQ